MSASCTWAKSSAARPLPLRGWAKRTSRRPSWNRTTVALSTSPAKSSWGGRAGPVRGVPGVALTSTSGPGFAQTANARASSALSEVRPPRAGQAVKSIRSVLVQASGATRTSAAGSVSYEAPAGVPAAAVYWGVLPSLHTDMSSPPATTITTAASPIRTRCLRRSRSVGRAWTVAGSNSADASSRCTSGTAATAAAARSAPGGSAAPAAASSARACAASSRSAVRSAKAARASGRSADSARSRASSPSSPTRGCTRSPSTCGGRTASSAVRHRPYAPNSSAPRSTSRRRRPYAPPATGAGVPDRGSARCTRRCATSTLRCLPRPAGRVRYASRTSRG